MSSALHEIVRQAPDLMPTTRAKYLLDLNTWIEFAGENPVGWTRATAQKFYNTLLERMRPQSATRLMASIRYASKWWAHQANKPELDFAVVRLAKPGERTEKRALTDQEAEQLILTCGHPSQWHTASPLDLRDQAIIVLALETGMRRMSLAGMTIQELVLDPKTKTGAAFPHAMVPTKGRGEHLFRVPLSDAAVAAIMPWKNWLDQRRGPLFRPLSRHLDNRSMAVFMPGADPISLTAIQKMVAARGEQAGIGHIYPHMFRHTFITWRVQAGLAPHEIASISGHTMKGGLGAIGGYMDMRAIGEHARNSTPAWLRQLMGV